MPQKLLSTKEAAERCGVAVSTFHGYVDAERISYALKGEGKRGAMWFDADAVARLAEELAAA